MDLFEQISALGDRPFLIGEGGTFRYADLADEVERIRSRIRVAIESRGALVALTGTYHSSAAAWLIALAGEKAIVAPLTGVGEQELKGRLDVLQPDWEVVCGSEEGKLRSLPKTAGSDDRSLLDRLRNAGRSGLILFSSGTTGLPKAMLHNLDTLIESYPVRDAKGFRVVAFMGIDHIGGVDILLRAIASGSSLVIPGDRSPEAICRLVEEHRADVLPATPSFLNLLLLSGAWREHDLSSLRIIGFGAERMPETVLRRLREVFPQVTLQQKFGTSETNAVRTVNRPDNPSWIRIEDPAVQWKIVDGELWLHTPSRILGYLNAGNDRLEADGWYRTGDLVEERDGYFRVIGRRESMINVGGEKVLPGEVETVIRQILEVADCRVFGEPNAILGQAVAAEVVWQGETSDDAIRRIRRHCRTHLAPHKVPVKVRLVEQIALSDRYKR